MRFSLIPFVLLVVPIMEISVFILVGSQIGVLPTVLLVIASAVAGTILLRVQGFGMLRQIRQTMDRGAMPGRELVHGVMIMAAGLLLLTPGFVTDTLGLLLFIPPVRDAAWRFLRERIVILGVGGSSASPRDQGPGPRTIDLDAEDYAAGRNPSSPWRGGSRPDG